MSIKISNEALQEKIVDIYDYCYTNSPVKTPTTIGKEVGKILHIGMYIEEVEKKLPAFCFSIPEIKQLNSDNSYIKEFSENILRKYNKMNLEWKIYNDELLLNAENISYICAKLNNILISDHDRDVFGDTLEVFRSKWIKQEGGQFFTDQKVTELAMNLLEFDPRNGDELIDLCSGTGGFLLAGLKHIKQLVKNNENLNENDIINMAKNSLIGQEIDAEVAKIGNATLLSRLGRSDNLLIATGNSLDISTLKINPRIKLGSHKYAATNPPFGSKITIKDNLILEQYELSKVSNANLDELSFKSLRRSPDILFIEQNIKLLKPDEGKLAIILPYQILSGPQTLYVRNWLLKQAHLLAVIDLPSETFQPHTGTKTALVLLKKRKHPLKKITEAEDHDIFMSIPKWIGHDRRGNPVYKKSPEGTITNEILSDFKQVENAYFAYKEYKNFSQIHENSYVLKMSEIITDPLLRINAQYYIQNEYKQAKILSSDFKKVKIKDVVKDIFFPARFKRNYVDYYDKAVPFLGGSNITQLIVSSGKWFRHDDPKLEQLQIKEGWLLITRSGTTGIVSSVPKSWDGIAMSEHVIRIIPDNEKLDSGYIHAFLKTSYCQKEISKGVFGSVIDEITPEAIGEIEIPIPLNKEVMKNYVDKMKKMEIAKEEAISNLYSTVNELNKMLMED